MKSYQALDGFHPRPSDNSIGWGPWKSWVRFPEEKSPDYISGHNRQTQPRRLFSDTGIIWIENTLPHSTPTSLCVSLRVAQCAWILVCLYVYVFVRLFSDVIWNEITLHTFYSNFFVPVFFHVCGVCVDTGVSEHVRVCALFLRRDLNWEHTTHILLQLPCVSPCVVCGHSCFWMCACLCEFSQTWFELRTHYTHSTPTSWCLHVWGVCAHWSFCTCQCERARVCAPFLRRDFNREHTTHVLLQLPPPFLHVHVYIDVSLAMKDLNTTVRHSVFSQTWF